MTEEASQTLASVATPISGSLLLTGAAAYLLCKPSMRPSLSWIELAALAFVYVVGAVLVNAAVLGIVCKAFSDHIGAPSAELIRASWLSAAWTPLLALLAHAGSPWVAAVPPLIVIPVALFLRRWQSARDDSTFASDHSSETMRLFQMQDSPSFAHTVLPAAATSVALELGVVTLLAGYELWAGLLFTACTLFPLWKLAGKPRRNSRLNSPEKQWEATQTRVMGRELAVAMLCTGIALLPWLKLSGSNTGMLAFLRAHQARAASTMSKLPMTRPRSSHYYSGVILFLPPKPKVLVAPPAPVSTLHANGQHAKPIIIPFDGVYWYFEPPDDRPASDARIVREDPLKARVRSSDHLPLLMQAHQFVGSSIKTDCCHALRVELLNADDRPGAINLEIILKDTITKGARGISAGTSLGDLVLPSSEPSSVRPSGELAHHPVLETLTFPFPEQLSMQQFDEITVVVRPAQERALVGARISIQRFVLMP